MTILVPKRSTESVLYTFDWTLQLQPTGDAISSFTLAVTSGTVTIPTANQTNADTKVQALIEGGADGETATLLLTVVTAGEQTLKRELSLLISDDASAVWPSTGTKRQACEMAFEEIGLEGYEFNVTPEEYATALRRLDALMAEWVGPGKRLDLGYTFPPTIGDSDLDDAIGVPDFALNTVALYLALAIMPAIGKSMSSETRKRMREGMDAVRAAYSAIPNRALPNSTPLGAGQKPWSTWQPFVGSWGRRR